MRKLIICFKSMVLRECETSNRCESLPLRSCFRPHVVDVIQSLVVLKLQITDCITPTMFVQEARIWKPLI